MRTKVGKADGDGRIKPFLFVLIIGYFTFEYVRPQDYLPFIKPLRIPFLLVVGLSLIWFFKGDKRLLKDSLVRLQIAFLALTAFSVVFAANQYWVTQNTLFLLSYLLAGVLPLATFMTHPKDAVRFIKMWILIHLFIAVGALIRGGTGTSSFLSDENDLALLLGMGLPYAYFFGYAAAKGKIGRLLYLGVALVIALGVIATGSRGGFLGLMAAIGGIILYSTHKVRNMILMGLLGLFSYLIFVPESYVEEVKTIQNTEDATRLSRFYYWQRGGEMFFDNPVLGVGSGNYPWRIDEYELRNPRPDLKQRRSGGRVAHSLYFTLLPEYGLVGTLVFAAMIIVLWRRVNEIRRAAIDSSLPEMRQLATLAQAAGAALLTFLVAGSFISVLYYPHVWYLIGIVLVLDRAQQHIAATVPATETMKMESRRKVRPRLARQSSS